MTAVIIPAAGKGKRMGAKKNKALLELLGAPILVRTLLRFALNGQVDEIIIAVGENETDEVQKLLKNKNLPQFKIVIGGAERQYSVENALNALSTDADIVLVHDAARPLVSQKTIEGVIEAARTYGAAISAVPVKDTVKIVENGEIVATPAREKLWAATTPQGFRREILIKAYEKAKNENFLGTDDASLVERLGVKVRIVKDEYENFKITTKGDLILAETVLRGET